MTGKPTITATTRKPRKCVISTAQVWYDGSWTAKDTGNMREAVICMENAFNHTENALVAARAEIERLRASMQEACDLLAERKYGNDARSPGHNARLTLETALGIKAP